MGTLIHRFGSLSVHLGRLSGPENQWLDPPFQGGPSVFHQAGIPALLSHQSVLPSQLWASTNSQHFRNADGPALKIEVYGQRLMSYLRELVRYPDSTFSHREPELNK